MENIPIASEFFRYTTSANFVKDAIRFAQLHAEAALQSANKNCKLERICDSKPFEVYNQDNYGQLCISGHWAGHYIRKNEDSILKAYPPENIK